MPSLGAQASFVTTSDDLQLRRRPTTSPSPSTNGSINNASTQAELRKSLSVRQSLKAALFSSWLNVLLLLIPISCAMHVAKQNETAIFVTSFLAIIPLAKLLSFATEELTLCVTPIIGGLVRATFGNAIELIIAIIALMQCKLDIVQSSLVGSILSEILLVLGICFFAGGIRFSEQGFAAITPQSPLLTLSVISLLIPAIFHAVVGSVTTVEKEKEGSQILQMSRGLAIVLLFIYGAYLVFSLWSHAHLCDDHARSTRYPSKLPEVAANIDDLERQPPDDDDIEKHKLSMAASIILLAIVTILVAITAEWLVDSIDGVTKSEIISRPWVGLILLPFVSNAAEHVTAVTVSINDKMTQSVGVAVGSSIQIALFVIPFITLLAWMLDKPLTLLFDPFQSVVLFLSTIVVHLCVEDGRSNWLKGMILICLYLILGITFWFYPGENTSSQLLSCIA